MNRIHRTSLVNRFGYSHGKGLSRNSNQNPIYVDYHSPTHSESWTTNACQSHREGQAWIGQSVGAVDRCSVSGFPKMFVVLGDKLFTS